MIFRTIEKKDLSKISFLLNNNLSAYLMHEERKNEIWKLFCSSSIGICCEIDEVIVGFGCINIENKIRGGKLAHLEDIVVEKQFSNKGIGKEIVGQLIEEAKKSGCYKITLACKEENIPFYEKCGFDNINFSMAKMINNK